MRQKNVYGYVRVSTKEQNEDRQMLALEEFPVERHNIYMDKLSGKDFNRPQYHKMMRKLKAGDVIVFLPNGNENAHYYVKRVVAVPGQTVLIEDGVLYVDGEAYGDESMDLIASPGIAENEVVLGADEYFVLGDNCNNSEDSRSANIGPVHKSTIIGKAWFHFGNADEGWGLVR